MANTGKDAGLIAGSALGTIVPGVGTAIGGALGSGIGGLFDSASENTEGPPKIDPAQLALLDELNQRKKSVNVGTDFAVGEREAGNALASTQDRISHATGGDIGATIAGLAKAQRGYGNNINQVLDEGYRNNQFFNTLASQTLDRISQRKLELQLQDQDNARAQSTQSQQDAFGNIAGAVNMPKFQDLFKSKPTSQAGQTATVPNAANVLAGLGGDDTLPAQ